MKIYLVISSVNVGPLSTSLSCPRLDIWSMKFSKLAGDLVMKGPTNGTILNSGLGLAFTRELAFGIELG